MDRRTLALLALTLIAGAALSWGAAPVRAVATACGTGSGHAVTLSNGTVSPGSGLLGTTFRFSVTYTDNRGCEPIAVDVTIDGVGTTALASSGSTSYKAGVVYSGTMSPPVGTWAYVFSTTSSGPGGRSTDTLTSVSPATIVVTAPPPPPTPRPTPTPTPKPTPKPTPRPTPRPTPIATPRPTPTPAPKASTVPPATPTSTPRSATRSTSPSASPSPALVAAVIGGGPRDGGIPIDDSTLPGRGSGGASLPLLLASAIASMGGLALLVAFLVASRRRRMAAEAAFAPPVVVVAPPDLLGGRSFAETRGMVAAAPPPDTPLDEIQIPRWRRPSVRAARQLSERDVPIEHVPLRFGDGGHREVERRTVTYRLVRVGTEPDEFTGEEVGRLDRGDEVEVLREEAGYCLVRTPLGIVGWIHRTTLAHADAPVTFEIRLETDF